MTASERLQGWRKAAPAFRTRQAKNLRQLRAGWHRPQRVSFVFGCQRSGTKMLMRILDESMETRIYHENNALAFDDFQLRPDAVLRVLTAVSPAPCQIFKPICDSQRAGALLTAFPTARGLWLYRLPGDVARSAVRKWGAHQRDVVDAIARGDLERWGWRTRGLPPAILASVRSVHRADLTEHEGALLFWWIRNALFFSQGLDQHSRMLLVTYEALAAAPDEQFPRVFAHVGARFEERFTRRVHAESTRRGDVGEASPAIRALCADLLERLDAAARAPRPRPTVSPVMMLINTLGVGGAERYVVTVANWMASQGAAVTVAAEDGDLRSALAPEVAFVEVPLRRVRVDLPVAALRVARLLRREPTAAIVAHSLAVTWVGRCATLGRRVPVVAIAHGWPDAQYRRVAPLLGVADMVVAVSQEVRAKLVGAGLDPARCEVIENGVDVTPFGPRTGPTRDAVRATMGAGPEDVLVLNLGRLTPQKAQDQVIAIAQRVRVSHPRLRFAIAGEGERADALAAAIRDADVQGSVRLLGLRLDVPDLLGAADIYLSCSSWEGMPLSTIEAMASELPCVATRTEGATHLLSEACGIVVPVGDVDALAQAVQALADDPDRRRRLGAAGRERALASFGHDRMARELAALLDRLVDPAAITAPAR